MSARVVTVEPSLYSRASSRASSRPSRRGPDLIDRLNALEHEKRSRRRHSHAGSLVLARPSSDRSMHDLNAEIRALEAEKEAYRYERRAGEERDLAHRFRERASSEAPHPRYDGEREVVIEDDFRRSRYGSEKDLVIEEEFRRRPERSHDYEEFRTERSIPPAELILYDRERYGPREVVYERAKTPPRNIIRVQKDRKGRLSLVRSSH